MNLYQIWVLHCRATCSIWERVFLFILDFDFTVYSSFYFKFIKVNLHRWPSIKYVSNWVEIGVIQNTYNWVQGEVVVCHASCVCIHLQNLFLSFWQHICLMVPCINCRNLILPWLKQDIFKKVYFYVSGWCLFQLNEFLLLFFYYFSETKLAKTLSFFLK